MTKNEIKELFNKGEITLKEAFAELLWGFDMSRKEAAEF